MTSSQRDKSISHFHLDPKYILQKPTGLCLGQFVFLDIDGLYKPAISTSEQQSNVQGFVYAKDIEGFWLKSGYGPIEYRFPVDDTFSVPGTLGDEVFLSATVSGGMQATQPATWPFIVGYKTDYGLLYRPDPVFCCTGTITGGSDIVGAGTCLMSVYELYYFAYNCSLQSWFVNTTKIAPIYGAVPSSLLSIALSGTVDITGGPIQYVSCSGSGETIVSVCSITPGPAQINGYGYSTDNSSCVWTVIAPVVVYGTVEELMMCVEGIPTFTCAMSAQLPMITIPVSGCCISASCPAPAINSSLNVSGIIDVPFSYTITATNSPTSFGCTTGDLTPGLTFSGATISGTPTSSGIVNVPISATNSCGTDNEILTITIASGGK